MKNIKYLYLKKFQKNFDSILILKKFISSFGTLKKILNLKKIFFWFFFIFVQKPFFPPSHLFILCLWAIQILRDGDKSARGEEKRIAGEHSDRALVLGEQWQKTQLTDDHAPHQHSQQEFVVDFGLVVTEQALENHWFCLMPWDSMGSVFADFKPNSRHFSSS